MFSSTTFFQNIDKGSALASFNAYEIALYIC